MQFVIRTAALWSVLMAVVVAAPAVERWRGCIMALERLFLTPTLDEFLWTEEATRSCGFNTINANATQLPSATSVLDTNATRDLSSVDATNESEAEAPIVDERLDAPPEELDWLRDCTITFVGDSTAIYMYTLLINLLSMRAAEIPYVKATDGPELRTRRVELRAGGGRVLDDSGSSVLVGAREPPPGPSVLIRYHRLLYASVGNKVIQNMLARHPESRRALVFVAIGTWDLNWKIRQKWPMPGLPGPVNHWPTAQKYWTQSMDKLFRAIADALPRQPASRRPLVVFREQYLPNCSSARFSAKNRRYRECVPLLRPVVVPFYRRALTRLAWAIDVPVIPGFIRDRPDSCRMFDGIHLDRKCMPFEMQLLLNVGRMVVEQSPEQGSPALEGNQLPASAPFAENSSQYEQWWIAFRAAHGLTQGDQNGTNVTSPLATLSPAPEERDSEAPLPSSVLASSVPGALDSGEQTSRLDSAPDDTVGPSSAVETDEVSVLLTVTEEAEWSRPLRERNIPRRASRHSTTWSEVAGHWLLAAVIFVALGLSLRHVM